MGAALMKKIFFKYSDEIAFIIGLLSLIPIEYTMKTNTKYWGLISFSIICVLILLFNFLKGKTNVER